MIDVFPSKHWWISPPLKGWREHYVLRYKGEEVRLRGSILYFSDEHKADELRKKLEERMELYANREV